MVNFFRKIIEVLENGNIDYMVSGSLAYGLYASPRNSRDFDFVIYLQEVNILYFTNAFKDGYYCDVDSIKDAVERKGFFNIIDYQSSYKADFIILKDNSFRQHEFTRKVRENILGVDCWAVTKEDLFIAKLIWIQDLQSGIQIDDLQNLLKTTDIDVPYIKDWITKLNLKTFNIL